MARSSIPCLAALVALTALATLGAQPAVAGSFIQFTDNSPNSGAAGPLSDSGYNMAVSWTQTMATTEVSLSVLVTRLVSPASASWYVTSAIGAGATAADVLYSGTYTAPDAGGEVITYNFNGVPRVTLGTGLSFAAGTYYLVLDGPSGPYLNNANWAGDSEPTVDLAVGITLGDFYLAQAHPSFAPAGSFQTLPTDLQFVFEMDGSTQVPLPGSLLLAATGLALLGLRRPRR